MPASPRLCSALSRARRAFSLIELAVVLIVIGVIAAIAIPTFQAVIERSEIRAAVSTQQAVARDVAAILAFQDGTTEQEALDTALEEAGLSAASTGLSAAGVPWTMLAEQTTAAAPDATFATEPGQVSWAKNSTYVAWATWLGDESGVKCRVKLAGGYLECWASATRASGFAGLVGSAVDSGSPATTTTTAPATTTSTTSTTSTTIPAPAAPANLVATAGNGQVSLTWDASAGATSYTVYQGTIADFSSASPVATPSTSTAIITGLSNGTEYRFWVTATGPGGESDNSVGVAATPKPPAQLLAAGRDTHLVGSGVNNQNTAGVANLGSVDPDQIDLLATGFSSQCVVVDGAASCWGMGTNNQLGTGNTSFAATPVAIPNLSTGVTDISIRRDAAGWACAVQSGAAKCWGANANGLGTGSTAASTPAAVTGLGSGVTDIDVGGLSACAVKSGEVYCWGSGTNGQLGNGAGANSTTPVQVTGISNAVSVSMTNATACAVLSTGALKCWGQAGGGQLGNGTTTPNQLAPVTTIASGVTQIAAGDLHFCAVVSGTVNCWGGDASGQLGDGTSGTSLVPQATVPLGSGVVSLSLAGANSCALLANTTVTCWGHGAYGQHALGTNVTNNATPVATGFGSGVTKLAVGLNHIMVLRG